MDCLNESSGDLHGVEIWPFYCLYVFVYCSGCCPTGQLSLKTRGAIAPSVLQDDIIELLRMSYGTISLNCSECPTGQSSLRTLGAINPYRPLGHLEQLIHIARPGYRKISNFIENDIRGVDVEQF